MTRLKADRFLAILILLLAPALSGAGMQVDPPAPTLDTQVQEITRELLITRDLLAEKRAVLQRRLRDIYQRGPLPTLQVLLSADSFADLLNRYKYLQMIARYDRRLTEEVTRLEAQLASRERALRNSLEQLTALPAVRSLEDAELRDLLENPARSASVLTDGTEAATTSVGNVAGESAAEGFERGPLSAPSLSISRAGAPPEIAASAAGRVTMGTLDWPLSGELLYNFGPVRSVSGEIVRWTGVGIAGPRGAQVAAAQDGRVLFAGPFDAYGGTVVLDHGGGYHTLYLYLDRVTIREGESAKRGQPLGTVGGPRVGEGPHIEFQLRVPGGRAVDPIPWLSRRE